MYDLQGSMQGPCSERKMRHWFVQGFFDEATLLSTRSGPPTSFHTLKSVWPHDTQESAFLRPSALDERVVRSTPMWAVHGEQSRAEDPLKADVQQYHYTVTGESPPPGIVA